MTMKKTPSRLQKLDALIATVRRKAKEAALDKSDIRQALTEARAKQKNGSSD